MSGVRSTEPAARILAVEDERKVAQALKEGLQAEGYEVELAATGEDGYFLATSRPFDALVLDVMLPGRDGLEILSALRAGGVKTPVLLLTARDAVEDRVRGLDHGADDYLVKPFAFPELLARIRALLRRTRGDSATALAIGDLRMDLLTRSVHRGGRPIELTTREFELLAYLVRRKGTLVSREMLARDVWRETSRGTPLDNVIDVHMTHLRQKIDKGAGEGQLIHTLRGVGFIVKEEKDPAQ